MKESTLFCFNSSKIRPESLTRCYFLSSVSKFDTHFEFNQINLWTRCVGIFDILDTPNTFTSQLFKTILMPSLMFFDLTGLFGGPKRSASFVSVHPSLNSANVRRNTLPNTFSNQSWALSVSVLTNNSVWLTYETVFYFIDLKIS